jgi:hypothetical protein
MIDSAIRVKLPHPLVCPTLRHGALLRLPGRVQDIVEPGENASRLQTWPHKSRHCRGLRLTPTAVTTTQ